MRLSWEQYFMNLAFETAKRSSCCRRHVGAIIVIDHNIVSGGYNGTPRGVQNCDEGGCARCAASQESMPSGTALGDCLCCHAEENAIVQAARRGIKIQGGTLYSTLSPCLTCAKMIINAGIQSVVHATQYAPNTHGGALVLLSLAKVQVTQFLPE